MYFFGILFAFTGFISLATCNPAVLESRATTSCNTPKGIGFCSDIKFPCKGGSYDSGPHCPGPQNIQCCVASCSVPGKGNGICKPTGGGCSQGSFNSGNYCPGGNDVQCCLSKCKTASGATGDCQYTSTPCSGKFDPSNLCPGPQNLQCCITTKTGNPPPTDDCKKTLSCTFTQIEVMSMQERLDYVRTMQSKFFGPLDSSNQFRAIEGVIRFFQRKNLGQMGSWVSYVDAGIVEGIQRGGAIALGMGTETGGNPGSEKWADFLRRKKAGELNNRNVHDKAWSEAEQAATEYGKKLGDNKRLPVTPQLQLWYWSTQLFRWIMRNRDTAIKALRVVLFFAADDFVNWLTDITQIEPTLCGAEAVWSITSPEVIAGVIKLPIGLGALTDPEVIKAIWRIYKCFRDN